MKTIEERAKAYSKTQAIECYAYCGYECGATEQRDIDIEKATNWLNSNWRKYIDTDADGMVRFAGWKNDFIKAMKE